MNDQEYLEFDIQRIKKRVAIIENTLIHEITELNQTVKDLQLEIDELKSMKIH